MIDLRKFPSPEHLFNSMFFPKNDKWDWYPIKRGPFTLDPGEEEILWEKDGPGWLYWALFWADNQNLTLLLDAKADRIVDIRIDFKTLYDIGFLALGQGFFCLTRYDTTNNEYVAAYAPIGFGVPFRKKNICKLINPTTSTITVKLVQAWIIMLY